MLAALHMASVMQIRERPRITESQDKVPVSGSRTKDRDRDKPRTKTETEVLRIGKFKILIIEEIMN